MNTEPTLSISTPLWFFGMGNSVPGYSDAAIVTANGASGGTFNWSIAAGANILSFSRTSADSTARTTTNTVEVYPIGFSLDANDTAVALSWVTPAGITMSPPPLTTQVDAPYRQYIVAASPPWPITYPASCSSGGVSYSGYLTVYEYGGTSFFGVPLNNVPVNESFGARTNQYSGNNWPSPTPLGRTSNSQAAWSDNLQACGPYTPPTSDSGGPGTLVFTLQQTWRAGSSIIGSGVPLQTDLLNYYTNQAVVTDTVTPAR